MADSIPIRMQTMIPSQIRPWTFGYIHALRARGSESFWQEVNFEFYKFTQAAGRPSTDSSRHVSAEAPECHQMMLPACLTPQTPWHKHEATRAGMVKWYHTSLPSSWCGFDSRYPLQPAPVDLRRLATTSRVECRMVEGGAE